MFHSRTMAEESGNIFERLIKVFFSSTDPEAEKRRQLKAIAKDLSKNKYKWYRPGSEEALPAMAKFFYELYKVVGAAQLILANANSSMVLKNVLVEMSFSDNQAKLKERFSEDSIKERAKTVAPKELALQAKNELAAFMAEFDAEKIRKIDLLYAQLELLAGFVCFDYFFLLKKFDSGIPERSFNYTPKFESIRGEYVLEDLKDFALVAYALPLDADWPRIFSIVKAYREVDPVAIGAWNKLTNSLAEIRRSAVLEQIIRHLDKNPAYAVQVEPISPRIVDTYLMKLKTQTEMVIQQIQQEKKTSKATELLKQIFGTDSIVRLKNYAERSNAAFEKKMLGGYLYVEELNYLKAFLIDYFKRDIRALTDLFLVRGKWAAPAMSQGYSGSFHELLELSDKITAFDDALAEDDEIGSKLRAMLNRAERDKEVVKQLRTQLKDVNDKALAFLTEGTQHFIVIARSLKTILEDHGKSPHALITNWKELELNADQPIKEWIVSVYKQIYAFVMLMQLFLKEE
ncbi:MAG TPA: DUF5312 family protein [Treponemataceae bacterium]|nr:DUF5312 family protein [Treponemataceae bacterium]